MTEAEGPKPKTERFTFLLDTEMREKLKAEAKRRDLNIGQLIRRALIEFFAKAAQGGQP
jgi:hypothetical protein